MRSPALLAAALTTTIISLIAHAFEVREGPDTCANAHAVVVASSSGKHDFIWGEIRNVIREGNGKWIVVDDYEPGVVQRVSLRQYDLKNHPGASAYVVHCGHGGTCNALVRAFFAKHGDWYSPEVFCGVVPGSLESPRQPD